MRLKTALSWESLRRHPLSTYAKKSRFSGTPPHIYALVRSHINFNKYVLSSSTPLKKNKKITEINLNKFHK